MGELRELADELRQEWRNGYWWADHQALRVILMSLAAGMIGLVFHYAELRMSAAMTPGSATPNV